MSSRAVLDLSTRRIKIYASAYDATARDEIAEHLADAANPHGVTATQIGLGNVDNTSDADKPVSTAQAAALAAKAPLASPALTGVPTAPTAPPGTATTQLATAAFVQAAITAFDAGDTTDDLLAAHVADLANPHGTTKAQLGLDAVDNTSDAAKPVSAAQQTAINAAAAIGTAAQSDIDGHQANLSNPHATTKAQIGLGNVDNTTDLAKPVSTATQSALNAAAASTATVASNLATHTGDVANPHATTKAQLGLGNVDNTSDLAKPVSTAQQAAINAAAAVGNAAQADVDAHQADTGNPHAVTKAQVGLGNVDNTADLAKPVSSAQQSALNLKAPLASPALTGTPSAPTAAPGTATGQLATTAFVDAAVTALDPAITAAAAAAAAAQADADAAQADATQALADAAAAQAAAEALTQVIPSRPGDAVALYGETKIGPPADAVPIDPAWVVVSSAGSIVRITAATAADPQPVAPIAPVAIEPGRVYEIRWRVQRQVNPADPLNDSVTLGVQWLTNTKAGNGTALVANLPLVVADGAVERVARIGIAPPATALLDFTAPAGTVYARPYVEVFGDAHTTDVLTIAVQDITAAVAGAQVPAITSPASGATVTMTRVQPLYVDNAASLAALTIRLPPGPATGNAVEIGFRLPVDALSVQDSAGAAIAGAPTNAYGPGAALEFRRINTTWVHWK